MLNETSARDRNELHRTLSAMSGRSQVAGEIDVMTELCTMSSALRENGNQAKTRTSIQV